MQLKIYQVDAFSDQVFSGNPAAVVPLSGPMCESLMQAIASENNLSETAFFYPLDDGFHLRWFTPTVEVPLCGHATLASAYVLFNEMGYERSTIRFTSKSGDLFVERSGDALQLDFPVTNYRAVEDDADMLAKIDRALGEKASAVYRTETDSNFLCVFDDEETIRGITPDFGALRTIEGHGVITSAPSKREGVDFVSRYFAPSMGIDEDPVTGSIHCVLMAYWGERFESVSLTAEQVSERGGALRCTLKGDRVLIAGKATLFLRGEINLPD